MARKETYKPSPVKFCDNSKFAALVVARYERIKDAVASENIFSDIRAIHADKLFIPVPGSFFFKDLHGQPLPA